MTCFMLYRPFVIFVQYVGTALLFLFSAELQLTAGTVVIFAWFLEKFFSPIQEISDQLLHIERALTASERLFNLLDVPNPHKRNPSRTSPCRKTPAPRV